MLSRTAENLFWMARNMERAENTARMIDVSFRMSLLPSTIDPLAYDPPPGPALTGALAPNEMLRAAELLAERRIHGPGRARECSCATLGNLERGLGEPELDLAASAEPRFRGPKALGLSRFLRLGEGALASLPRRGVWHHAA